MTKDSAPDGIPYKRLPSSGPSRGAPHRLPLIWSVVTIALAVGLALMLILAFVPLRKSTQSTEPVQDYTVAVPAGNFGVQFINADFHGWCNSQSSAIVGNLTYWLTWQVSGSTPPDYVRLQYIPFATLYNASEVLFGGFAQSSANAWSYFCNDNLVLGAFSNISLTMSVQVGVICNISNTEPVL